MVCIFLAARWGSEVLPNAQPSWFSKERHHGHQCGGSQPGNRQIDTWEWTLFPFNTLLQSFLPDFTWKEKKVPGAQIVEQRPQELMICSSICTLLIPTCCGTVHQEWSEGLCENTGDKNLPSAFDLFLEGTFQTKTGFLTLEGMTGEGSQGRSELPRQLSGNSFLLRRTHRRSIWGYSHAKSCLGGLNF